jgi:hypothetical protein
MKISRRFSEDDKKKLEHMISLQFYMPYVPLGNRKLAHKVIYILTPILYILSICLFVLRQYVMFAAELTGGILSTVWIIWYQRVGKKFEERVHKVVYEDIGGLTEAFVDESGIIFNNKSIGYNDISNVIFYDEFMFAIWCDTKFLVIKINTEEKEYIQTILDKQEHIVQELQTKPFNLFLYFKVNKSDERKTGE